MPRDLTKLARADLRTFTLLASGPLTSRATAAALQRSDSTAVHSLARLVLYGLATAHEGTRLGFGSGSPAWIWTLVPGAVFPGFAPRKNAKYRARVPRIVAEVDDAPLVRPRRAGTIPEDVVRGVGLAGLTAQMMRGNGK